MKLLIRLFIFMGLASVVIGFFQKFFHTVIVFNNVTPLAHLVFANTCLLLALILKLAND
jgi:hypothetical protein